MTVEFTGAALDAPDVATHRPPWLVLASAGSWMAAAALLAVASTRTVWTYETSWPTGSGVTSGRVTIAYDAWGTPKVTNLSDFQSASPPPAVPWAWLLLACAGTLVVSSVVRVVAGHQGQRGVLVRGASLVITGALVAIAVAATLAQTTFRSPLD